MLAYYKLDKTKESKEFFFNNDGYFNFWNKLLVVRIKKYSNNDCAALVLVNKTGKKTNGDIKKLTEEGIIEYRHQLESSIKELKPKEMFKDFPELLGGS